MKNRISVGWFLIVICIMTTNSLIAQDSTVVAVPDTTMVNNKWQFLLELKIMIFPI